MEIRGQLFRRGTGQLLTRLTQSGVFYMTYSSMSQAINFRDSLFQMLPKGSFEIHDEYLKHSKRAGNKESLSQRMQAELNQYISFAESKFGEEVLFGQDIVLKHFDSEYYLVASQKCSEYSTEAFQVRLQHHPSTHALFRIEPYQSYQGDGQKVYSDEPFLLINAKHQFYLDYIQRPIPTYDDETKFEFIKRLKDVKKFQLIITHNSRSNWKARIYLTNQQIKEKKVIRTNDLVYLQYSGEELSFLSGENQVVSLASGSTNSLHAIWELQVAPFGHEQTLQFPKIKINNSNGIRGSILLNNQQPSPLLAGGFDSVKDQLKSRIVPPSEQQIGRQRGGAQEYILRHFISGKVLTIADGNPMLKAQGQQIGQTFEIVMASLDQTELCQNSYIQIQFAREVLQKVQCEDQWNSSDESVNIEEKLMFAPKENIQHAFQIKRIPNQIKNNLMYVQSAQELLFEFSIILDQGLEDIWKILNSTFLESVIECMEKLINFLSSDTLNRQQCMKETYIIEVLMHILIRIAENLFQVKEYKNEKLKIENIFKLTYELIKQMTANNKDLKLHVSKWLEVFLKQAMMINEARVQESLKELLDDNYEAIDKFITEDLINRVIENMVQNPHEKYPQILSSVCVCKDRAIARNQNHILAAVFQSEFKYIQFRFKISNGKVFISSYIKKESPNWRTLKQLYNDSGEVDDFQTWNYFQSYINLLADLCHNRNRLAQDFVKENYPITIFLALLEDPLSQQTNAIEPYLKIIHLAFVDNVAFNIQLISKIIYFEQPPFQDIQSVKVSEELSNVMVYIQNFIAKFSHFGYDLNYNKILLRVLKVLQTTLKLGFWQSIADLHIILHNLLRICSCEQDFKHLEEKQNEGTNLKKAKHRMIKMTQENQSIMECKMLSCHIIIMILDQENYVRINQMVKIFQDKLGSKGEQQVEEEPPEPNNKQVIKQVYSYFSNKYQALKDEKEPQSNQEVFRDFAKSFSKQKDQVELAAFKVQPWIQDLTNLLASRDLFKDFPLNIIYIFVEISLFQNPRMVELSLLLLSRLLGQRRELLSNFSKIVLLSSNVRKDEIELTKQAIQIRARLERLTDTNIYLINLQNQSAFNLEDIFDDLNSLCPALKLVEYPTHNEQLPIPFNEMEENDKMHQTLFRALALHETLVTFVTGAEQLNDHIAGLLSVAYKFLTLFIWNHAMNKTEITWPLRQIYSHLQFNSYCIDFVRELFQNNKELLYNENEVRKAVRSIVDRMNQLDKNDFYKVKLIDALRVFQYDHNKIIKQNQTLTLTILQERQYKNLMYILNVLSSEFSLVKEMRGDQPLMISNLWEQNDFNDMIQQYAQSYSKIEETKLLRISPQLMYLCMFFELFSILVEEKNSINVEKCRGMHPYTSLLSVLKHCYLYNVWPLQHFLRGYINRLYYNSELENICPMIIEYDLDIILHQIQEIILLKESKFIKQVQIVDGVRFSFLFPYIFATLQEILYSINLVFVNETFLQELEDQLGQPGYALHAKLFKIAATLSQVEKLWFKSSHISRICSVLINIFKCIFRTLTVEELDSVESLINEQDCLAQKGFSSPTVQSDVESRINKLLSFNYLQKGEEEQRQSSLEYTLKRMFHLKKRKTLQDVPDDNKELNIKLTKLVRLFNENQEIQRFVEDEFNQDLCMELDKIDEFSLKVYQTPFPLVTLKEFIKNLVQINIQNKLNDQQRFFFLKVLVRMVSEKNRNVREQPDDEQSNLAIDEWSPEFWSESKDAILEVQNFLDDCGAAQLIYEMLKENFDDNWSLFNQLLIFANAFLLGGNTKCQSTLLELLKQDQQNQVMINLQQQIVKFSKYIQTNFKIHKTKQSKYRVNPLLSIVYLDNLTMFNEQTETLKRILPAAMESQNSIRNKQLSLKVMQRAFRMLQLMCENNNVNMKNFLREQIDKEEVVQLNSIDFIEFATKQLRMILKILNKSVISIASQLVDFINEVIQLPCHLNQSTLCKSTFFEDVCFTFETLHKDEQLLKLRDLNMAEQKDQLFELQGKIVQSIMLVLEGNDSRSYDELQSKLETKFLVNFVQSIINKMEVKSIQEINFKENIRFSDEIQQMLNVFIIQQKILCKRGDCKWLRHFQSDFDARPDLKDLQSVCLQNLRKIEIYYQDQPQMVFFPAHPVFEFLSSETRDQIMFNIPRDTQREKLINLLEKMDNIFGEISYNFRLQNWRIPITHRSIQFLINTEQLLSLIINFFMIQAYAVEIKDKQSTLITDEFEQRILLILSCANLIASILACSFYIISRAPLEFKKLKHEPFSLKRLHIYVWVLVCNTCKVFKSEDFLSHISYASIAIFGTFANTYYFSLHLFYLFGQLSLLQSVFQAISHNAQQLSLVALLGVLFQFVFSIVGFNNYVDDIYQEEPADPCHSVVSCMITLMTSGVIGSSMSQWDPLKFMYDTVYFVFFALLFTNIISGIMTDTFAQLRDLRENIDKDKKNYCFICGVSRQTLEKNQEDFEDHIQVKHFLWNYVFYIYCLKNKDSTEYTGLEYWIMDKVENEHTNWFPVQAKDSEDLDSKLEEINKRLDGVVDTLLKIENSII